MSTKKTPAILLLLPLALAVACTDKDRAQAAKKNDGVESFHYKRPDMKKYIKKESEIPTSQPVQAPTSEGSEKKKKHPQSEPSPSAVRDLSTKESK
jgi:hypothetical protein